MNPNLLACFKCGGTEITVSESQQMLMAKGQRRLHADVRCNKCDHRWWSRHHTALEISRAKDQAHAAAAE